MKASEVLKRYAEGERDFRGVNLRGQSFKEQNLSGADFSFTKIHGTDFTKAILRKAKFNDAKAGLQRYRVIFLVVFSWLLSAISTLVSFPSFVAISLISGSEFKISGWVSLLILLIFLILIICKGIRAGAIGVVIIVSLAIVLAVLISLALLLIGEKGEVAFALAGSLALASPITAAAVVAGVGVIAGAIVLAEIVAGEKARVVAEALIVLVGIATAGLGVLGLLVLGTVVGVGMCIGHRTLDNYKRDTWIHSFAIFVAAIGGTTFRGADLTDANFTGARLKSTDLRKANLTRTNWFGVQKLNLARFGGTYLENEFLQRFLITGKGQYKNFDRQDLRGVNLQGAELTDASFIDTDLSQADLQGANLFGAKLVQTNLDKANLSNADLTGAYIEDWGITINTLFEGIKGDYVYQKLPTKKDHDPNRMPPSQQGNFGENDLYIFITSVLDTLDLYHRQNINAGVAITVLKGLTEDYPAKFELVGIEKRGDNQYVMKLKVFGQASHFQLQREYYARYEQTLPFYDPKMLMPDSENMVAEIIKTVKENPGTHIENLHNQGIVITGGKVDMSGNIEIKDGNYNENIEGDCYKQSGKLGIGHMSGGEIKDGAKVAGVINEAEKQNLADAAQEIQQLLEQLSETYPTTTNREKMTVVGEAVERIEGNPPFKAKVINALKAGGTEAFKEAVDHPLVNILVATIEGWQDAE